MLNLLLIIASLMIPEVQPLADTAMRQEKLKVERLPDMNIPRSGHNVFCVDGELTVVGGRTSGSVLTPTAEYFADGAWHLLNTVYPHDDGMAVVLGDGQHVLLAGSHEKNLGIGQTYEAEMYYPKTHSFEGFGCLDRKRAFAQGAELANGEVVITGNHLGNDAIEMFDGQKTFRFVKEVENWRRVPYVLPIGEDEVMVFGIVWREGKFLPCDTVSRLQGAPFTVPLLKVWMPIMNDQNSHSVSSFIGDKAAGDYSYLVTAHNSDGEVAFLLVRDTVFSLLPTTCPVPMESEWGRIIYRQVAVADRAAQRAYMVGTDSTGRVYVVAVDYGKNPAPLTLYYSDPLTDFGDMTPVLTPDGNLVMVGGIIDNNFSPLSSVWLLKMSDKPDALASPQSPLFKTRGVKTVLCLLGALLLVGAVIAFWRRRKAKLTAQGNESTETPLASRREGEAELMDRISGLMENERLYLNPELKVGDVADALGVSRNAVSVCINSHQGCSFSQYVNDYRLQHAKRLLTETPDIKVSAVGLESGFANERTFFRAFKSATDMTPKEWKDLDNRDEQH